MIKPTSIIIKNYKSISELTLPLNNYGEDDNKSNTTILVGLNESGKSSILDALNLMQKGQDNFDFFDKKNKSSEADSKISSFVKFDIEEFQSFNDVIKKNLSRYEDLYSSIVLKGFTKIFFATENTNNTYLSVGIKDNDIIKGYILDNGNIISIEDFKKNNDISTNIKFTDNQSYLTKIDLEIHLKNILKQKIEENIPRIFLWRAEEKYLINEAVDLETFKNNPDTSIPLKNIFSIYGANTQKKIKLLIDNALNKFEVKAELEDSISSTITKHINDIWKEHQINIKIRIEGKMCSVHIEDKDSKYKYFNMSQRSAGFIQFISILLSISAQNESGELKNSIILLDEPETHLHPSGVRYLRDELLKIGKNNHVIIATHSHYMIDTETPERHFIVSKEKLLTKVKQVDKDTTMFDDEVLSKAFGIEVFKELLPENILVVEGGGDKAIISRCITLLKKDTRYSIKSAGGAAKVYGIAALLSQNQIPALIMLDDDKEGRDVKGDVFKRLKGSYHNEKVFTIRDIQSEIPKDSTIEDLMPISFVKDFFDRELGAEFNFDTQKPCIEQLKNQSDELKKNKDFLNKKKAELAEAFLKEFNTLKKIETNAPLLHKLALRLVEKL